jgi:hypothetical protein
MKKIFIAVFITAMLFGCTDKKAQEKTLLDDVIKVHEKVMNADEQLMNNKMQLDTLVKAGNFSGIDTAKMLIIKLTAADSAMENWMHQFDPDQSGKSDADVMTYMNSQKKQIMAIDSALNSAIAESNKYLHKIKGK